MDAAAKNDDLLYVVDSGNRHVDVFTYPGGKLVGTLYGFESPAGECVDRAGDVFVTDYGLFEIVEYAHGKKSPIATLSDSGYEGLRCSIDPTTGNLAVMNDCTIEYTSYCPGPGDIGIYRNAKGTPKYYTDPDYPKLHFYSGGYDDRGDLFADGSRVSSGSYGCVFSELPKGKARLYTVTFDGFPPCATTIQWDGKYFAVSTASPPIYRFAVKHLHASEVGTIDLGDIFEMNQFWIEGGTVVVADYGYYDVKYYNYPAGGSPTKTITGFSFPYGTTISRAHNQ